MNKETKKLWWTVGSSFATGMLVAFLGATCYCCPSHADNTKIVPNPEMVQKIQNHHKMHGHHHGFKHQPFSPEMREHFAQKLGLSDEQKATLEQYRQEDMPKWEALKAKKEVLREEFKALHKQSRQRFESVLTDEQKEILKTMKPKHPHKPFMKHDDIPESPELNVNDSNKDAHADEISTEIVDDAVIEPAPAE